MRAHFDEQLNQLNIMLTEMGALVETAISRSVYALEHSDRDLAQKTIMYDKHIDDKEQLIESLCLRLLLQQQPVAKDLRLISAALKMITDLERIGDQAADIAEITMHLQNPHEINKIEHVHGMATEAIRMVTDSIDAFVRKDLELAKAVVLRDDNVDNIFVEIRKKLVSLLKEDSDDVDAVLDYLMVAKYFERIGDHATNVAEWVIFSITGEHELVKSE